MTSALGVYPVPIVWWRGVEVRASMARALDAALLPADLRPTGSRSGLRTWSDYEALVASGRPASRTSRHFGGEAVDLSPSSVIGRRLDGTGLVCPIVGEPWHVEPAARVYGHLPDPWRWMLPIAELGRERWAAWCDPAAPVRWPGVALVQARCGVGVDDVWGPVTRGACGWGGVSRPSDDAVDAWLRGVS